jgi:acyl-CoA synthetase (NDP forming)
MTASERNHDLDFFFYPRSLAIVGISTGTGALWSAGRMYLEALELYGFKGAIYLVNQKGGEFQGRPIYPSVLDLPEAVDLVVCCIGRQHVPQLIRDCAGRGVRAVSIFTGGFSERTGEDGRRLEDEIMALARNGGVRVVGPNCLGNFCPESGLAPDYTFPRESGPVGLICQSGGNALHFVRSAAPRGVRLNKFASYGNACDINESDLLDYMAADPAISIIAVYIEGVRDGQRFYRALRAAARVKPVVLLKGGVTEAGARAAACHSGALASSARIWEALCRQAGVVPVQTMEDLIDVVTTFLFLPRPSGRKVGLTGMTGGATVLATDECHAAGLEVPPLPEATRDALRQFFRGDPGLILDNPIDISTHGFVEGIYDTLKIMQGAGMDLILVQVPLGLFLLPRDFPEAQSLGLLTDDILRLQREGCLPMAVAIHSVVTAESKALALACQRRLAEAGVPVYNTLGGAARAVSAFIGWHERRDLEAAENPTAEDDFARLCSG